MQRDFTPVTLLNGEKRSLYIRRRWSEGVSKADIYKEIHSPELYSGPLNKQWTRACVDKPLQGVPQGKPKAMDGPLSARDMPPLKNISVGGVELSEDEKAVIRARALAEVNAEEKKKLSDQMLARAKDEIRSEIAQAAMAGDEKVEVLIDLAPYADRIVIDGKVYMQGAVRTLPQRVAAGIREICARTWDHQAEVDGKQKLMYRKRQTTISESTGGVRNAEGLRV